MQVTLSFVTLLSELRCAFTAPSYLIFLDLMSGWVLSHRHRYVTDLIWSSGSTQKGHHSRYHRFFSHGAWSLDVLCKMVARLLVRIFAAAGLIEVAVDDSLCRKRGLTVYGAGMHHDPLISSRAKPLTSWGHDWVVLALIVRCPFWAPTREISRPSLVYKEVQAVVRRRADDAAPVELPGWVSWIPAEHGILENSGCPDYRIYQPRGLTKPPRHLSRKLRLTDHRIAAAPSATARSNCVRKPRNLN